MTKLNTLKVKWENAFPKVHVYQVMQIFIIHKNILKSFNISVFKMDE